MFGQCTSSSAHTLSAISFSWRLLTPASLHRSKRTIACPTMPPGVSYFSPVLGLIPSNAFARCLWSTLCPRLLATRSLSVSSMCTMRSYNGSTGASAAASLPFQVSISRQKAASSSTAITADSALECSTVLLDTSSANIRTVILSSLPSMYFCSAYDLAALMSLLQESYEPSPLTSGNALKSGSPSTIFTRASPISESESDPSELTACARSAALSASNAARPFNPAGPAPPAPCWAASL